MLERNKDDHDLNQIMKTFEKARHRTARGVKRQSGTVEQKKSMW